MNINSNQCTSNRPTTPQLPVFEEEPVSPSSTTSDNPHPFSDFSILHFNCQNSVQITHEALTLTQFSLLALQEPWFNSHSLVFPHHNAWHRITAYDYLPSAWSDRPRVCIYLTKLIPTANFSILPSSTDIILAIDIREQNSNQAKIRVVSWYNPPNSLRGFMTLKHWLSKNLDRRIPTILVSDSNLHHLIWNPPGYLITDPLAKKLVHLCSSSGLRLISPRGVPTRFSTNTHSTTIDLAWASWNLKDKVKSCEVATNIISSDHFPVTVTLDLSVVPSPATHISFNIAKLDHKLFQDEITLRLQLPPTEYSDSLMIDNAVSNLSNAILEAAQDQGKKVTTKLNRYKSWWDVDKLTPILKNRNRARKWMIKSGLPEARACYSEWQKYFRDQISRTKANHWRKFLANCTNNDTFKAFRYVKPGSTAEIAPLKKSDGAIATTKEEQAGILYYGTSVAHAEAELSDIPSNFDEATHSDSHIFPCLEIHELRSIINKLPTRKARGEDSISNELLKLAMPAIEEQLCRIFNACFRLGFFPTIWRKAITIIIRKHGKDNYSDPNAYRPIALLSCLGKVLEKVITNRLTYWAETTKVIAAGHMGGRRNHCTDDALLLLTTWVKERWRDGEVVSALSLDVKSAYPSVHKRRLWFILHKHRCPGYLLHLVKGFLSNRSTNLRLQDYLSVTFNCDDGLPQGSPLSVILYIIYNSPLLQTSHPDPKKKELSLGFIDDIIHLVASKSLEENMIKLKTPASISLTWARTHGAIFDKKKAQLIHFSNKRQQHNLPNFIFGDAVLQPRQEIKWLGIWLDSKLLFNSHLNHVKKTGDFTIHQLRRLSKCFSGLSPKEVKRLIITVLYPRISYGSIIWFTKKNFVKANKIISSFQNTALNLILGAFRGSSTDLMYHDAYMLPFHLLITRKHHFFYLQRLTSPDTHPTQTFIKYELALSLNKHKSPIQDMLGFDILNKLIEEEMEVIYPHSFPPWTKIRSTLHNLDKPRDKIQEVIPQQVKEEEEKGSLVIFTDGSASADGGGAAAVSSSTNKTLSLPRSSFFSNHETELLGILLASQLAREQIRTSRICNPVIAMFGDNQGVLRLVNDIPRATSGQHLVIKIQTILRQLPENTKINLYWTPGHAGIDLNEKADELAKQASSEQTNSYRLPASLGSLKKKCKASSNLKLFPFRPGSKPFTTKPKEISESLLSMEKGRTATIIQLRAGHSPLNDHLFKRQLVESPLCSVCKVKETTEHFLIFRRKYKAARKRFRNRIREEEIRVNWNNAIKILDTPKVFFILSEFILETQRFVFFQSYTQDPAREAPSRNKVSKRRRSALNT